MKCKNCNHELNENVNYCPECGQKVDEIKVEVTKKEIVNEEKRINKNMSNDTFFCVLSLLFLTVGSSLATFFYQLAEKVGSLEILGKVFTLSPFIAFALAIYAKVKYPKSKFAKVLFIVYLVLIVLAILYIVFVVVACYFILRGCTDSNLGYILINLIK